MLGSKQEAAAGACLRIHGFDGSLHQSFHLKGAGGSKTGKALFVAFPGADIHNSRYTAPVLGIESAGIHVHGANGLCLENGEETDGVEGIVDRHTVEQNLVLYRRTTPDIDLPALVAGDNDARQYRQVLGNVRFTARRRQCTDFLGGDGDFGDLHIGARLLPRGRYTDGLEIDSRRVHAQALIDNCTGFEVDTDQQAVIAYICCYDFVVSGRQITQ